MKALPGYARGVLTTAQMAFHGEKGLSSVPANLHHGSQMQSHTVGASMTTSSVVP